MKRIIAIIILAGIAYGGWLFNRQSQSPYKLSSPSNNQSINSGITLQNSSQSLSNLEAVLGASITTGIGVVTDLANTVTDGAAEPVINKAISNFQAELKQLPEDQVKKIQYNYCKGIVSEYEKME